MKTRLMPPGTLSLFWENITDSPAPHSSILNLFAKYISKGDEEASEFLVYLIESNLYHHTSSEQRALWVASRIGGPQMDKDDTELHAA